MQIPNREEIAAQRVARALEEVEQENQKYDYGGKAYHQASEISQLGRELMELGFKSKPLILMIDKSTSYRASGHTTATQFLCSFDWSSESFDDENIPPNGSLNWCFGIDKYGHVRFGYSDNRAPYMLFNGTPDVVYQGLAKIMRHHLKQLKK